LALYQGTTLVGPYRHRKILGLGPWEFWGDKYQANRKGTALAVPPGSATIRALGAVTEGRTDAFPRGIRLAPEVRVFGHDWRE
jgi:hypothetical protein